MISSAAAPSQENRTLQQSYANKNRSRYYSCFRNSMNVLCFSCKCGKWRRRRHRLPTQISTPYSTKWPNAGAKGRSMLLMGIFDGLRCCLLFSFGVCLRGIPSTHGVHEPLRFSHTEKPSQSGLATIPEASDTGIDSTSIIPV